MDMIDIESGVYDRVYSAVITAFPSADIASMPIENPAAFPHVACYEISNSVHRASSSLAKIENHARIGFQIDIFSNKQSIAKSECKSIAETVDVAMLGMGFMRTFASQTPNIDRTVFRYTLRYEAIVSEGFADGTNIKHITYTN